MIVWICEVCGTAIEDGEGSIFADDAEVANYEATKVAWEAETIANSPTPDVDVLSLTTLMAFPEIHWQRLHYACDPVENRACYSIAVSRIRTEKHVIKWTAHLMGKDWLACTDWDHLLELLLPQLPD